MNMIDIIWPFVATLARLTFVIPLIILAVGAGLMLVKESSKYRRLGKETLIVGGITAALTLSTVLAWLALGVNATPIQLVALAAFYILTLAWVGRLVYAATSTRKG